jgi:putative flippase GtrA
MNRVQTKNAVLDSAIMIAIVGAVVLFGGYLVADLALAAIPEPAAAAGAAITVPPDFITDVRWTPG